MPAPLNLLSLVQAAEIVGVDKRTIRRYIATGKLPAYRLGTATLRVKSADLEALLTRVPTAGGSA